MECAIEPLTCNGLHFSKPISRLNFFRVKLFYGIKYHLCRSAAKTVGPEGTFYSWTKPYFFDFTATAIQTFLAHCLYWCVVQFSHSAISWRLIPKTEISPVSYCIWVVHVLPPSWLSKDYMIWDWIPCWYRGSDWSLFHRVSFQSSRVALVLGEGLCLSLHLLWFTFVIKYRDEIDRKCVLNNRGWGIYPLKKGIYPGFILFEKQDYRRYVSIVDFAQSYISDNILIALELL